MKLVVRGEGHRLAPYALQPHPAKRAETLGLGKVSCVPPLPPQPHEHVAQCDCAARVVRIALKLGLPL